MRGEIAVHTRLVYVIVWRESSKTSCHVGMKRWSELGHAVCIARNVAGWSYAGPRRCSTTYRGVSVGFLRHKR